MKTITRNYHPPIGGFENPANWKTIFRDLHWLKITEIHLTPEEFRCVQPYIAERLPIGQALPTLAEAGILFNGILIKPI